MCGIVGAITKHTNGFTYPDLKIFETLLFLDTLRGEDSTGVFAVNNLGNVGIAKEATTAESFLKTEAWQKYKTHLFQNGWCVVGHNRKATRGKVSDENAHPFWVEDKLVLVHNGSYFGSHDHLKKVEVDSHAIAHTLAEHGDLDVEGALKKINAAYALIWYDIDNKKLNVIRNDQRPLHWVETPSCWFFASEMGMLDFALSRELVTPLNEIYSFGEHELNSWELQEDKSCNVTSQKLDCKYDHASRGFPKSSYQSSYMAPVSVPPTSITNASSPGFTKLVEYTPKSAERTETSHRPSAPILPGMKRTKLKDAKTLFTEYSSGKKISVTIDDYLMGDKTSSEFVVVGNTLDQNKLPVAFKVNSTVMESLTDPDTLRVENAVFDVTIDFPSWRRQDAANHRDSDEADGVMVVMCSQPVLRFDGRGHGLQ